MIMKRTQNELYELARLELLKLDDYTINASIEYIKPNWVDAEETLKWLIKEYVPTYTDCKIRGINRKIISEYAKTLNIQHIRDKKLEQLLK